MSDHEAKQATPHATLLAELLDSRVPKSEREHAAKREIERLTASLKRANETAEHFERHWYLRGDEIERLTAERDALLNALETMLIGACAVGVPHAGERQVLQEAVDSARAVINAARKEQA